jgi:hypothetical protein
MRASDACHNREFTPQNQHRHEERTETAKIILSVRFFYFQVMTQILTHLAVHCIKLAELRYQHAWQHERISQFLLPIFLISNFTFTDDLPLPGRLGRGHCTLHS